MILNRLGKQCRGFSTITLPLQRPWLQRPWLFVGLGNPGDTYKGTRHNVGFEMIDAFAESQGILMDTLHCKALFGQGFVGDTQVLLAKPQSTMYLSGESSGALSAYYKIPLNRVLVLHDDTSLPSGVLRLVDGGGSGDHDGLKSVINNFRGDGEFPRLRIGIGKPPRCMDPKTFLLQKFIATDHERGKIDAVLQEGVDILKRLLSEGLPECARQYDDSNTWLNRQDNNRGRLEGLRRYDNNPWLKRILVRDTTKLPRKKSRKRLLSKGVEESDSD